MQSAGQLKPGATSTELDVFEVFEIISSGKPKNGGIPTVAEWSAFGLSCPLSQQHVSLLCSKNLRLAVAESRHNLLPVKLIIELERGRKLQESCQKVASNIQPLVIVKAETLFQLEPLCFFCRLPFGRPHFISPRLVRG